MHKLESNQQELNSNMGALSKALKEVRESNKDFMSKQHMVTERLVSDIHKQGHSQSQQTSLLNKEISDVRDSMQQLASNLQKNFNECIKAAIQQCSDLNVQNSNSIQSLRKMSDSKIAHLQQLLVDSQKRAQSQNTSILDIINSNQKNQSEFQNSFKGFFEKFRDSMHQNLSALQESSQEQISYLDNVLRAEVKSRMKQSQSIISEADAKLFALEEKLEQFKRDSKRSWDFVEKNLDALKESQQHATTANQPMHKIITNLTSQFDELGHQHLTDVKSIMMLNQDTSEKTFNQIKSLQVQMQQLWTRVQQQERQNENTLSSPNGQFHSPSHHASDNQYLVRPQSYKSDMSSTAAFNAIKHHLNNMPGKPTDHPMENDLNNYIDEVTPMDTPRDPSNAMNSASRFVDASPRPRPKERESIPESNAVTTDPVVENQEIPNDESVKMEETENAMDDDYEDDEYADDQETSNVNETPVARISFTPNDDLLQKDVENVVNEQEDQMNDDYEDEQYENEQEVEVPLQEDNDQEKVKEEESNVPDDVDIDDMLDDHADPEDMEQGNAVDALSVEDAPADEPNDSTENEQEQVSEEPVEQDVVEKAVDELENAAEEIQENQSENEEEEEYGDEEYEEDATEDNVNGEEHEEQEIELSDTDEHQSADLTEQEQALAMLEQEQSELIEPKASEQNDDYDSDDF